MCHASMESRRHFHFSLIVEIMEKLVASFETRTGRFQGSSKSAARIGHVFAGLHDSHLRPQAGSASERNILLEAGLRKPEPKIAGARQWRNAHQCQGTRLARVYDRLLQPDGYAATLPSELDGS